MLALHLRFVLQYTQNSIMLYSVCNIILTVQNPHSAAHHPKVQCALHQQQQILMKTVKREKEMAFIINIK